MQFQLDYKKQIFLPLLLAVIVLTASMVWLFLSAYHFIEIGKVKVKIDETRYEVSRLLNAVVDAETGERGYIITNNVSFLEPYENGVRDYSSLIIKLSDKTEDFPELRPTIQNVKTLVKLRFNLLENAVQTQLNSGSYASHLAGHSERGKLVMDQIRDELNQADGALNLKKKRIDSEIRNGLRNVIYCSIALILAISGILLFSYKRTVKLFDHAHHSRSIADEFLHQANHDSLTNIANRRGFEQHLKRIFALAQRDKRNFAVFYMDLDGFKNVNDQYGHDIGDEALIIIINRFTDVLRTSDYLARVGGDEFALIVEKYSDVYELSVLGNRIIKSLDNLINISGKKFKLGVSIGVATYPKNASDYEKLIAAADSAMYLAKANGKNKIVFAN